MQHSSQSIFQQLVDSPEWTAEYVDKYAASPVFLIGQEAQDYMQASEDDYRELKKQKIKL